MAVPLVLHVVEAVAVAGWRKNSGKLVVPVPPAEIVPVSLTAEVEAASAALKIHAPLIVGVIVWLSAGAPSERRKVVAEPLTAAKPTEPVGLAAAGGAALVQPPPESDRSAHASRATVKAPPAEVCLTTWLVPPVAEKSVVPAGRVSVFAPAVAAALSVIVPEVAPFSARSPELTDWTPDQVFAAFRSGMVAPDVPVAVEQPVAPLLRSAQAAWLTTPAPEPFRAPVIVPAPPRAAASVPALMFEALVVSVVAEAAKATPPVLLTVTASVPEVVASPERSPLVMVVAAENLVRLPEAGVPVVETEPPPDGVAQVPSPRQKVEDEALVPLFRRAVLRLPVRLAALVPLQNTPASETSAQAGCAALGTPAVEIALMNWWEIEAKLSTPPRVEAVGSGSTAAGSVPVRLAAFVP